MTYFGSQLNIKFSSWVVSFSISFKIWTASSTLCKFRLSFLNDKSQNWRNETSRRGQALLSFEKKIKISSVSGRDDVPMVLRPSAVTNTVDAAKALEARVQLCFLLALELEQSCFEGHHWRELPETPDKSQEQFIAPLALTKLACELRSEFLYYKKFDWLKGFFKKGQITYD